MCVNCFSKLFITKHTHNTQRHRKQCWANIKNTTARDEPTPVLADEKLTYISDVPLNILKMFEIPMHRCLTTSKRQSADFNRLFIFLSKTNKILQD